MLELCFDPYPTLKAARLMMRRITVDDIPAMYALRSNRQLMSYIDRPMAESLDDARTLIEKMEATRVANEGIAWGITLAGEPTMIGTIGFWRITKEHYRAEIGYLLHPDFQRQGIMTEALAAAVDFGFQTMGLHSVEANVNPANIASIRLLESAGFVREAYFRENYFWNGEFLDSAIYSKLAPTKP